MEAREDYLTAACRMENHLKDDIQIHVQVKRVVQLIRTIL